MPAGLHAATPGGQVNPFATDDPDGVPLAVTQADPSSLTPEQAEALQKQQLNQEARARNWLLLEYEQQFRHDGETTPRDRTMNMYLQLSMNKGLAAVTADSKLDYAPTPSPTLHATAQNASTQNSVSLRPDASPNANFAPLISPYNSPVASSATQPFYSGAYSTALPSSLTPTAPVGGLPESPAPAPHRSLSALPTLPADTVDMQTPGMIADKADPLPGMPNLNLDSLADPSVTNPQNPQQAPELPESPQPLDAGLLHQEMNIKLAPAQTLQANASSQKTAQKAAAPPAPPPPETPEPINKQQQLSPVHAPLPSPFDIINR
jgi:hypothetical protein